MLFEGLAQTWLSLRSFHIHPFEITIPSCSITKWFWVAKPKSFFKNARTQASAQTNENLGEEGTSMGVFLKKLLK